MTGSRLGLVRNALLWLLLAAGVICCAASLFRRAAAEDADREVAFSISYEAVQTLARAGGRSTDEWLRRLSGAGVRYLIGAGENETAARAAAQSAGMAFARSGETARPGDAFLLPPMDEDPLARDPITPYAQPLGDAAVPLALVENRARTGVLMPEKFDPAAWNGPVVRAFYLYAEYRQNFEDGNAENSPEDILFRAVTERGARLVVLTSFRRDTGELASDPAGYESLLGGLTERLEARGLRCGGAFSVTDAPRQSSLLLAGGSLLPAAAAALFLHVLLSALRPEWGNKMILWELALLLLGTLAAFGGAFAAPGLLQVFAAFGTAVLWACWGALCLAYLACDGTDAETETGIMKPLRLVRTAPLALRFPLALLGLALPSLTGGLCIGALLASPAYLLEFRVFTGVKAAQLAPLLFAAWALFYVLFRKNARREREKSISPVLVIFVGVCVAAALFILLLRSGDNAMAVSALELRARNWLERTLYARPRTKEFLLAFPGLALFIAVSQERREPVLALPLGVLAAVGATSIVNTFCHIFTPLRVSMARTLLGLGLGLVIGYLALALAAPVLKKTR